MVSNYRDKSPKIHEAAFIAPSADVVGDVTVGEKSGIWHHAVLRGDVNSIEIGSYTNVQDGTIVHVSEKYPTIIGNNVTIGHGAIVHACTVKDNAFIGMGAIILDGAVIGEGALIGAGALVTEEKEIPPLYAGHGNPGKSGERASGRIHRDGKKAGHRLCEFGSEIPGVGIISGFIGQKLINDPCMQVAKHAPAGF